MNEDLLKQRYFALKKVKSVMCKTQLMVAHTKNRLLHFTGSPKRLRKLYYSVLLKEDFTIVQATGFIMEQARR